MFIHYALAHAEDSTAAVAGCPMCQWMMGGGSPFWGDLMIFGMAAFWLLLLSIMVLLVVWLVKQIKK